jgi:hypothetical protein
MSQGILAAQPERRTQSTSDAAAQPACALHRSDIQNGKWKMENGKLAGPATARASNRSGGQALDIFNFLLSVFNFQFLERPSRLAAGHSDSEAFTGFRC